MSAKKLVPKKAFALSLFLIFIGIVIYESKSFILANMYELIASPPIARTMHISGIEYIIPANYIFGNQQDNGKSIFIGATWPDMQAINDDPTHAKHSVDQNIFFKLIDAQSSLSLQHYTDTNKDIYEPYQNLGIAYGLHHFETEKRTPLKKQTANIAPADKHEIYTDAESNTSASVYIDCDTDNTSALSTCSMWFSNERLMYEVSFQKSQVKDWQLIKNWTVQLVTSFRHAATPQE